MKNTNYIQFIIRSAPSHQSYALTGKHLCGEITIVHIHTGSNFSHLWMVCTQVMILEVRDTERERNSNRLKHIYIYSHQPCRETKHLKRYTPLIDKCTSITHAWIHIWGEQQSALNDNICKCIHILKSLHLLLCE